MHNYYPLPPERLIINGVEKLIPNLNDKEGYIFHHKTLKHYLDIGLKIKKIHSGIRFEEEPWLKSHIELNTNLRAKATKDFKRDFFELMNNSVFGKTMEKITNHVDVRLVNDRKIASKLAAKPNFKHYTIFNKD